MANPLTQGLSFIVIIITSWYLSFYIVGLTPLGSFPFPAQNTNSNQFIVFMALSLGAYFILFGRGARSREG